MDVKCFSGAWASLKSRANGQTLLRNGLYAGAIKGIWASKHGPFTSIFHSGMQSIRVKISVVGRRRSHARIEPPASEESDC